MRKFAFALAVIGLLAVSGSAVAEIGTIDDVPAATLLLPYFEVDLSNPNGINTLFSINNASRAAAVAHVTLWTDWSIPTFDFDVYLTGYDVQTISVRDIFNGIVPRTAEASLDTGDALSPSPPTGATQAAPPVDDNFGGTTGPCGAPYGAPPQFVPTNLQLAHTGKAATIGTDIGSCFGATFGDNIARGYITVDNVVACNLSFPSDTGYAVTLLRNENQLWGDYFYVNGAQNFAQGETLVHVEACRQSPNTPLPPPFYEGVGNGAGYCPLAYPDYTFYGRYVPVAGQDQREPLATTFATRFVNGGQFTGGTDLIVWRDSKTIPTGIFGPQECGDFPAWFPLNQDDVVSFDEQENAKDECTVTSIFSPPSQDTPTCFPLEAGRYPVGVTPTPASFISPILPTSAFGWLYLNLNFTGANPPYDPDPYPGIAQAWVTTVMDASGLFSVGFDAIKLDSALQPENTNVRIGFPFTGQCGNNPTC
jgi:hypothetical protein